MDSKWLLAALLPTLALAVALNLIQFRVLLSLLNRGEADAPKLVMPTFRPKVVERRKPVSFSDEDLWRREQKEAASGKLDGSNVF